MKTSNRRALFGRILRSIAPALALASLSACLLDSSGRGGPSASTPACGDGIVDGPEACDGADLGGQTCQSLGFLSGELLCASSCALDASQCQGSQPTCGDGKKDAGEACDGQDLNGQDCIKRSYSGGELRCNKGCAFDESRCFQFAVVRALDVTAGGEGQEILTDGVLIAADHFGDAPDPKLDAAAAVKLTSGIQFGVDTKHIAAGWTPLHSTDSDQHSKVGAVSDANFRDLMRSYVWVAYVKSVSHLSFSGLKVGDVYRLQLISVNPESCGVSINGGAEAIWSGASPSTLTLTWIAASASADVALARKADEINFNAYALHDITPAAP